MLLGAEEALDQEIARVVPALGKYVSDEGAPGVALVGDDEASDQGEDGRGQRQVDRQPGGAAHAQPPHRQRRSRERQ